MFKARYFVFLKIKVTRRSIDRFLSTIQYLYGNHYIIETMNIESCNFCKKSSLPKFNFKTSIDNYNIMCPYS
ncbi:unnamed protein product [Pneumocystis jirovecii]|uniref:Uncharacterized protein n=1 Tax=Pneumocystis jirovecii TaxID=42068 RepID=L0PCU8_PNEJI|nr:unnamed protein product [Pneumocystis jirovecii]